MIGQTILPFKVEMTRDPPASPECSRWRAGKGFKGYMPIVGPQKMVWF